MNKAELINSVAAAADVSKKEAEAVVSATFDAITAALKDGDKVQLVGFGSFEVKKRAARVGRNPKTKESIEIPASVVPVFKAGKALKDAVAKYGPLSYARLPAPSCRQSCFPRERSQSCAWTNISRSPASSSGGPWPTRPATTAWSPSTASPPGPPTT